MAVETYECILSGSVSQQFVQSILHCGVNNTADTSPFTIANALITEFNGANKLIKKYTDACPADYQMTSIRVRRILPTGGPTAIKLQAALVQYQGQRPNSAMVSSDSPLLIWLSDIRPSRTGRLFMPGIAEGDCLGNVLDVSLVTVLDALGTYWRAGGTLASPSYEWDGQIYRRAVAAGDAISNYRVSPIVGTQRRRQRPI